MSAVEHEIAAAAAALMVDEGLDALSAKKRAVRALGLGPRTPLPGHALIDAAVREHLALFHADTQPGELRALRELALAWMDRLAEFQPLVGGAVWLGTATRMSDIHLHLFSDDPKAVELWLINRGLSYDAAGAAGWNGEEADALSLRVHAPELDEWIGLHLRVQDTRGLRGALRPDRDGQALRGDAAALRRKLNEAERNPA